ncbi:hypothetical protein [Flavobacterium sp.]|uniref:hypothetical protein n=1 Tax=Flavobacterium sp. TaxID=239 RepID=UPI003753BE37
MESNKIETILEKYFRGETSIAEENALRDYFSSSNVSSNLEQYKPIFGYLTLAKKQKFKNEIVLKSRKRNLAWLSIAASVVVLLGIGTYSYFNYYNANQDQDLGTYDDPEIAFRETQKALSMLSTHLNTGIESVQYVQEYENSKNLIFKQQ